MVFLLKSAGRISAGGIEGSGQGKINVMPFRLCNTPTTFQQLMEDVLLSLQWKILVLYLDDVVIYAETMEEHLECLGIVLEC